MQRKECLVLFRSEESRTDIVLETAYRVTGRDRTRSQYCQHGACGIWISDRIEEAARFAGEH